VFFVTVITLHIAAIAVARGIRVGGVDDDGDDNGWW